MTLRERIARAMCLDEANRTGYEPAAAQRFVESNWLEYADTADAVLAEIEAAGMVLVPKEPTEAMLTEGHYETGEDRDTYYRIYRAMLSAAGGE
jgi:hypothetical protein